LCGSGLRVMGSADRRAALVLARRLARLREELMDLEVPLPIDADGGGILLEELDYACHPALHEGRPPRYGALVSLGERPLWDKLSAPTRIESAGTDMDVLRRLADGRASFVVRRLDGPNGLVCFDGSLEYEASAVRLRQET